MKYLVMVQGSSADYDAMSGQPSEQSPAWSEKDVQAMFAFMGEINDELTKTGELNEANGLVSPAETRLVSAGKTGPVIKDDPYGKNMEMPAGYWVLDCESLERVTEIAARIARCPIPEGATDHPVVIRPIQEMDNHV
jgi:hypothetical protein